MKRVVFITGGSRGLGAEMVLRAVQQGWDVAFTYLQNEDKAQEVLRQAKAAAPDARLRCYQLDVRDSAQVDQVAEQAIDEMGSVYGVICNAGISRNGMAYSVTDEDWRATIDTNLTGSFFVCRAFLPELVANRAGRILLLSSVIAPGAAGQIAYAASKSGLIGLAGTLAREYGRKGITTNVLVPGYFDTDMTREGAGAYKIEFALKYGPLGRPGAISELAKTALFLLSEEASYINGEAINITGGLNWIP